jgi:hypothetical protein
MATTADEFLFEILTPLGFQVQVHLTNAVCSAICSFKHPVMARREQDVASTLSTPIEIRRSRGDPDVYLFYGIEHHVAGCAWSRSVYRSVAL